MSKRKLTTALLSLWLVVASLAGCGSAPLAPRKAPATAVAAASPHTYTVNIALPPPKAAIKGFHIRHVNLDNIAYMDVRATHMGQAIDTPAEGNPIPVVNRSATAILHMVNDYNNLITAQGLDARGRPIPGAVVKGVLSGVRNPAVNAASTPAAKILEALFVLSPVAARVGSYDVGVQNLINQIIGQAPSYTTSPSLVDTDYIAQLIAETQLVPPKALPQMVLQAGTVTVHVVNPVTNQPVSGAAVVVGDPLSNQTGNLITTDGSGNATITNVPPGTWTVIAGGTFVPVQVGQAVVGSGQTVAADPQPTCYTPQQTPTQTVTQVIGASGGTISVSNVLDLIIPAHAVNSDQTFHLSTYADPDPTRFYGFRLEPLDLHFDTDASLVFHYTDAQLSEWHITDPTATGNLLLTQYRPGPEGSLPLQIMLPAAVDVQAKTVTASLPQTGVVANPGLLTVQGLRIQDGPTAGNTGSVTDFTRLEDNGNVTLNFSPIPLTLEAFTNAPIPQGVNMNQTSTFTAWIDDVNHASFDYTQLGLELYENGKPILKAAEQKVTDGRGTTGVALPATAIGTTPPAPRRQMLDRTPGKSRKSSRSCPPASLSRSRKVRKSLYTSDHDRALPARAV